MLSRALDRLLQSVCLRLARGDSLRADELRARGTAKFLGFIMISYLPLIAAVLVLVANRPAAVDATAERDQLTYVAAFAARYVDVYLKDPTNKTAIKRFYDGDFPASAVPAGGRALRASSCLPGVSRDGFQTYSVLVDAEIPKAANAVSMVAVKLQVDISADEQNLLRAFTLPHARPDRLPGRAVQLGTQTLVAEDRPVYRTVSGFLAALLTGQGEIAPYVVAGSTLTAERPPRFTAISIEQMQTNSEAATAQTVPPKADGIEVTARAILQTASGVELPMDFPLVMSVAAGHWQVDRLNDAPSIAAPAQSGSGGSPTTAETTPTTTTTTRIYAPTTVGGTER
ncbi:hypothetical protein [Mycobacterium paragordonae]|uniref:Conjugal transfer protein n=1 Tax=Mycobacterium paragordonae TaxID=1389713 RepID=A0AAJ1S8J5_9MYCO|nr:hypothetical protein [Mycobacterium paragordonae]MBI2699696.1 hypothetical protein [Mycobacterium sp.]MDP7739258.1 hypothetical protein [Mycobacterium paragordonae]TDL04038.1 hypothetical protein EUA05_22550 [Mycobacterium paragordonae]